jgi:aspartate dehydrogenase
VTSTPSRPPARTRVALIGFGAIGGGLAELVADDPNSPVDIVGALVRSVDRAAPPSVPLVGSLDELLDLAPDVVAEAAGHEALRSYGPACLERSVPLVVLSTGALADADFESRLRTAATAGRTHATIASGAVGGLDLIASAAQGGITRTLHTIVKPPGSLGLESDAAGEIFRGSSRSAATAFPQNANVAASVALAGLGLDRSEVAVVADPAATRNRHEIAVEGAFGSCSLVIEGFPSRRNPRTGALVPMSLKHELEKRRGPIVIG